MKRYTEKKAAAVFNSILAESRYQAKKDDRKFWLSEPWENNAGYGVVLDGFRIIRNYSGIPAGISQIWTVKPWTRTEREEAKQNRGKIENFTIVSALREGYTETEAPTEDYIRENKHGYPVQLPGDGEKPYFNSKYLIDFIKIFPDAKWMINPEKGYLSPVLVVSEHGDGYLLPVMTEKVLQWRREKKTV